MPAAVIKAEDPLLRQIQELETSISELETALTATETAINQFSAQLRTALYPQIIRIRELSDLYKKLKTAKKAKRLEQKKKGKNYREPQGLQPDKPLPAAARKSIAAQDPDLKKLYKAAMWHVHPDKFAAAETGKNERATELTQQLIEVYESGDLAELKGFYEYIISGNAMAHLPFQPQSATDPQALLQYLRKKNAELTRALETARTSELYHVLLTYADPMTFIPELRQQFEQKIHQLEKRTRKAR